jgi:hypothetical protein
LQVIERGRSDASGEKKNAKSDKEAGAVEAGEVDLAPAAEGPHWLRHSLATEAAALATTHRHLRRFQIDGLIYS